MDSLAELIYTAGFFQAISCLQKCGKISGQAGGFAGNIDNMIYPIGEDFRQCFGMNAVSGRIQNDHIEFLSFFLQLGQKLKHIPADKFHPILHMVQRCVPSGLLHPELRGIDSKHMSRTADPCV